MTLNGKSVLVKKNLDIKFKSKLPDGTEVTNLERMKKGLPPLDPATGKSYHLHHIGQNNDGILALLTEKEHLGNDSILHTYGKDTEIDRNAFETLKRKVYKALADQY